MSVTDSNA